MKGSKDSPSKIVPKLSPRGCYLRLEPLELELLDELRELLPPPKLLLLPLKLLRLLTLDERLDEELERLDEELREGLLVVARLLLLLFTVLAFRLLEAFLAAELLDALVLLLEERDVPLVAELEPLDEELLVPVSELPRLLVVPRRVVPVMEIFWSLLMEDSTLLLLLIPPSARPTTALPLPFLSPRMAVVVPGRAELLPGRVTVPSFLEGVGLAVVSWVAPRSLPRLVVPPRRSL